MQIKGVFPAFGAAILFGLSPTITKIAYIYGANPIIAILLRYTIAVIIIIIPLFFININFIKLKQHIIPIILMSLGSICLTTGLLVAVIYIPVSIVALIFYTYPIIVLIFYFYKIKKIKFVLIIGFISTFLGIFLVLGPNFSSLNFKGIFFACLAAIGAATVLITNENLKKNLNEITIYACTHFICFTVLGIILVINFDNSLNLSYLGWLYVILAGLFYAIAFYLQIIAVKIIGSAQTSLLLYLEPIIAIIAAIILLGESLSFIQTLGVIIVIISLITTNKYFQKISN